MRIGFKGLLTLVLVVAKLLGLFPFSWLWVFAPIWIPLAVVLMVSGFLCCVVLFLGFVALCFDK